MSAKAITSQNFVYLRDRTGDDPEWKVVNLDALSTAEIQGLIQDLNGYQIELDRQNRLLQTRLDQHTKALGRTASLNDKLPLGVFTLDSNNIITDVNSTAASMLGVELAKLKGQPITLYLAPQDQGRFFLRRNKVLSSQTRQAFQANFMRSNRSSFPVQLECVPASNLEPDTSGMVIFARDISDERRVEADRNYFSGMIHGIMQMSRRLTTASVFEIDAIIEWALEKIGKFIEADRAFVFSFHSQNQTISNCNEWCAGGIEPQRHLLIDQQKNRFPYIVDSIEQLDTVHVADVDQLPLEAKFEIEECCMTGVRSVVWVPMIYGKSLCGFMGCASGRSQKIWTVEQIELMKLTGELILNARMRTPNAEKIAEQPEKYGPIVKRHIKALEMNCLYSDCRGSDSNKIAEEPVEIWEGPIQILDESSISPAATAPAEQASWGFRKIRHPDSSTFQKLFVAGGRSVRVTCPNCTRENNIQMSDIPGDGDTLEAICPCGSIIHMLLEFRKEARKKVEIRGIFMKVEPDENSYHSQDQWGSIQIHNISKSGIGFVAYGNHSIRVNDQFTVKFTLDNALRSVVRKPVIVRVVKDNYIGCEFVGSDKYDSTLGFYLMGTAEED